MINLKIHFIFRHEPRHSDPPDSTTVAGSDDQQASEGASADASLLDAYLSELAERSFIEQQLRQPVVIDRFPSPAGSGNAPSEGDDNDFMRYSKHVHANDNNPYHPFKHQIDWDIAQWAKLHGPSSNSVSELLSIHGVRSAL